MKIWLTRHGQTKLNRQHLMQGRIDEPLNETGISQARQMRALLTARDDLVMFDAVYASPLERAVMTGAIIGGIAPENVITDERITEADFGPYDKKKYYLLGPSMSLYWACPELFPAPAGVETVSSMIARSHAFLRDLEKMDYENVLVSCHGGILRVLCGYLENRKNGIRWRPKPHNCEIRIYESVNGTHRLLEELKNKS